jgi:hypothetical protein
VVDKSGAISEQIVKSYNEDELYKKAKFKTNDGFSAKTTWNIEDLNGKSYSITVFGKIDGRANQENKYEFPPPIDTTLFFGSCIIVNKIDNIAVNLTSKEWDKVYEHLYGGFEDIGDEDSDEEEIEDLEGVPLTKNGYVKDGFVVDDDADDDDEQDDDVEQDDEDEPVVKVVKKRTASSKPKKDKKTVSLFSALTTDEDNYLDCTSELSEEAYFA